VVDCQSKLGGNCSCVGQTSGLPVHGGSDSVPLGSPEHRAGGPANRQTGDLPHVPTGTVTIWETRRFDPKAGRP